MITSHQRGAIKRLLSAANFDNRTVTYQHRRLNVPENLIGSPVDTWLDTLDPGQASKLIAKLEDEADEGDEDDED